MQEAIDVATRLEPLYGYNAPRDWPARREVDKGRDVDKAQPCSERTWCDTRGGFTATASQQPTPRGSAATSKTPPARTFVSAPKPRVHLAEQDAELGDEEEATVTCETEDIDAEADF